MFGEMTFAYQLAWKVFIRTLEKQYEEKITNMRRRLLINSLDPSCLGEPLDVMPAVDTSDLVSYFVQHTSFITPSSLKHTNHTVHAL